MVAGVIIAGSCLVFPALLSSLTALSLTCCLSLFVGLNIALPPLNPNDDWVPIHGWETSEQEAAESKSAITAEEVSHGEHTDGRPEAPVFDVLPVHLSRIQGLLHLWEQSLHHRSEPEPQKAEPDLGLTRKRFDPEKYLREHQSHRSDSR